MYKLFLNLVHFNFVNIINCSYFPNMELILLRVNNNNKCIMIYHEDNIEMKQGMFQKPENNKTVRKSCTIHKK